MLEDLSERSKSLWAKVSDIPGDVSWLPLVVHMSDTAGIGCKLWMKWLPYSTKETIVGGISHKDGRTSTMDEAERILIFLAAAHDLGKATPAFQGKRIIQNPDIENVIRERVARTGLPMRYDLTSPNEIHHSLASEMILERNSVDRSVAVVLGGHHGRPPSKKAVKEFNSYEGNTGFKKMEWCEVQNELFKHSLSLAGLDEECITSIRLSAQAQVILTGIIIMADWMASDEGKFPYGEGSEYTEGSLKERIEKAWTGIDLPSKWSPTDEWKKSDLYESRFEFKPRTFQKTAIQIAKGLSRPGLMIIEAPMGEGKTEAALAVAEVFAEKFGNSGVFFALPTQATADGIFPRIVKWIEAIAGSYSEDQYSLFLAHGKSRFNKTYSGMSKTKWNVDGLQDDGAKDHVIVHEWLSGRKKGVLSDFVIGTIDQILMGGLKQKHLAMRHLGLANKVIIIDECHAYDSYMGSYLEKILQWLGAYNVPVIILSATLPPVRRFKLISAYSNIDSKKVKAEEMPPWVLNKDYPIITYTDDGEVKQVKSERPDRLTVVSTEYIVDSELIGRLDEMTVDGGYVGLIYNTVGRAQEAARLLKQHYGGDSVHLLHAGYTSIDRTCKEAEVMEILNNKNRKGTVFVVGTQVMEQSLDLDFDLMVTELCPIDLMIQRMGRLHRHENPRPSALSDATCFVIDTGTSEFEKGSMAVYGKYQLMNSRLLLPKMLRLPDDIVGLVHAAYDPNGLAVPEELSLEYAIARKEMETSMAEKNQKAEVFQIRGPTKIKDLVGWLDDNQPEDKTGKLAESTVRDTDGSLEVILITRRSDGKFYVLPWVEDIGGAEIPSDKVPRYDLAFGLAGCKVRLPRIFSTRFNLDRAIRELEMRNIEELPACWQESDWLTGELFLVLDEHNIAALLNIKMQYSSEYGLVLGGLNGQ